MLSKWCYNTGGITGVFGAPCCSFREVILLSVSSMKPSSTDSLPSSSPAASVGRNT